ncbi:MAG: hypothetical protein ABH882_00775 [Candidatus Omnitrophota bacterium]|nr:hypothetical protein [Candidatus Omnitrophota bacterium]
MNSKNAKRIELQLAPGLKNAITFLGSGDFHHVSGILLKQFTDPISLIIFDNHPDWDILPPKLGCGSWVSLVLKQPNIKNVVILGVSSQDLSSPLIYSGNLSSLKDDRVRIYPYSHSFTRVNFRKIPENQSIKVVRGLFSSRIEWQELKGKDLKEFLRPVFNELSIKKAYISIDKDCLKPEYALTNWEDGNFKLSELLEILSLIKENLDIAGVDITGEYSMPVARGLIRNIGMNLDHPRFFSARDKQDREVDSVNEKTNLAILNMLWGQNYFSSNRAEK